MSTDHEPPPPVIEPPPETSDAAAVTLKDPKPNQPPPTETSADPPHVQHEETDENKLPTNECPPEDDQATSNQSSQTIPDATTPPTETEESSSKNKPMAEEVEAIEPLKNEASSSSATTGVDPPHVQQVTTPVEHEETDQNKLPTNEDDQATSTQSSQPKTIPDATTGVDPPHVQQVTTPAEHEETDQIKLPTNEDEATLTQSSQPKTIPDAATPPPKIETPVTLKDPKPNQPPPTEIEETRSKNNPVAEEVDAIEPLKNEASPAEHEETDQNKLPTNKDDQATSTQSSQPKTKSNDTPPPPKKSWSWDKLIKPPIHISNLWPKGLQRKKSQSSKSSDANSPDEKELESPSKLKTEEEVFKHAKLKKVVEEDVIHTDKGINILHYYKDNLNTLCTKIDEPDKDLSKLKQDLIRLSLQFPLKYRLKPDGALKNFHFTSDSEKQTSKHVLPQLHNDSFFEKSPAFEDFEARYNDLHPNVKLCLLCFSVFPENQIVKKRVMVHWWLVEGFALDEKKANENFNLLIKNGFVEPVNESRNPSVGSCKMHPFYRSALVMIAQKAKFLNFSPKGEPTQNFAECFQSCLVGEGLISYEDLKGETVTVLDLEKVHLLINISEAVLEFKRDWFSKMINLNVLYLGRWEPSATGHREVEDTLFLEELKNMKFLKFLSLQGVSNMIDLPDSVTKLTSLEILDISACHNLESIPERIGCLRFLTHLDMTDCYLLEHMPKSISSLEGLKVLKGFVVGSGKKSCKLEDLKELKNLVKLCVYTGLREFPRKENVKALNSLKGLRKLTITWGGSAFKKRHVEEKEEEMEDEVKTNNEAGLPLLLEKLDLRYFPTSRTPEWLKVGKMKELKDLKKLYIRAGKFSDLGQYQESDSWEWPLEKDTWRVEVLRLRYLPCIEMEWRQVQELFPELVYLEQVGCPKLSLFPCDANGVWMKKKPK